MDRLEEERKAKEEEERKIQEQKDKEEAEANEKAAAAKAARVKKLAEEVAEAARLKRQALAAQQQVTTICCAITCCLCHLKSLQEEQTALQERLKAAADADKEELQNQLEELKDTHAHNISVLSVDPIEDVQDIGGNTPPSSPVRKKKKRPKDAVGESLVACLPPPELGGSALTYWLGHVHVFEYSHGEEIAIGTSEFINHWQPGGPDAIITDKPWGHLDSGDGTSKDQEIDESAVKAICKGWYDIQPADGRVAVRLHEKQLGSWAGALSDAGYTVWKNSIRTLHYQYQ